MHFVVLQHTFWENELPQSHKKAEFTSTGLIKILVVRCIGTIWSIRCKTLRNTTTRRTVPIITIVDDLRCVHLTCWLLVRRAYLIAVTTTTVINQNSIQTIVSASRVLSIVVYGPFRCVAHNAQQGPNFQSDCDEVGGLKEKHRVCFSHAFQRFCIYFDWLQRSREDSFLEWAFWGFQKIGLQMGSELMAVARFSLLAGELFVTIFTPNPSSNIIEWDEFCVGKVSPDRMCKKGHATDAFWMAGPKKSPRPKTRVTPCNNFFSLAKGWN